MNTQQVLGKGMEALDFMVMGLIAEIHLAYVKAEAGLTINMTMKIEPTKDSHVVSLETAVNFVESRIKRLNKIEINDTQDQLFKTVEKLRPKAGSGIDSVTLSTGEKSVTLTKKEKGKEEKP